MVAVANERTWKLLVVLLILEMHVCMSVYAAMSSNNTELRWISRRQSFDIYNFINSSSTEFGMLCNTEKTTYLISDQLCVKEQELNGNIIDSP